MSVKPNMITLQWSLPSSEQNGILTGFVITYFVKVNQEIMFSEIKISIFHFIHVKF